MVERILKAPAMIVADLIKSRSFCPDRFGHIVNQKAATFSRLSMAARHCRAHMDSKSQGAGRHASRPLRYQSFKGRYFESGQSVPSDSR